MDKCIIEGWWWYSETSEITILCSKQTQRHFWSVHSCSKTLYFVPIACKCMLANCGANTRRPVWSAYVLHITMPIELCITYPEMLVFTHTRLAIVLEPLMPCWETTCIDFYAMLIFIQLFYSIASNVWCVAVTLVQPLHVSEDSQSKEKGKTKQATLTSDFHAHGSKSSLWPIRLVRS